EPSYLKEDPGHRYLSCPLGNFPITFAVPIPVRGQHSDGFRGPKKPLDRQTPPPTRRGIPLALVGDCSARGDPAPTPKEEIQNSKFEIRNKFEIQNKAKKN